MEAMSLSVRVDAGVIGHNNRSFVAKNVISEKISDNITYVKKDLKETYKEIFSEALEKYNAKQTRSDRVIKDYYEHIKNGNQEKLFYEAVIQFVFIPEKLRKILLNYIEKENVTDGAVFVTRNGKPVDRSNIWRNMKKLCDAAHISPEKVFPHNLRHLFARAFYAVEKDIVRLSDILGHSNISTTRIYTIDSGKEHLKQINRMNLVLNLS